MKVLEVCTSSDLGGLELYFETCCKELKKRNIEVQALVLEGSKLHQRLDQVLPCMVVNKGLFNSAKKLSRYVRQFKPDVVHVHHKKDLLKTALVKKGSSREFTFVHTRQMDLPGSKKDLYHRFIYGEIDLYITITDFLKKQVLANVIIDESKVQRLYYGIPKGRHNQEACTQLQLDRSVFHIASIARIDPNKRQHILIEAVKKLLDEGHNINLHLIGHSTDDAYLAKIKHQIDTEDLSKHIKRYDFVEKPNEIMSCFDIIVLASALETFGMVLPEAMRSGTAVIGSRGGGVPEIIDHGQTGLLFVPDDVDDLKDQIERMLNDDFRNEIATQGKIKADTCFEFDMHFDKLIALFETTLEK